MLDEPTPATTLVIILGASTWPDADFAGDEGEWTPFARSAGDFYDYVTNPEFLGIPKENVFDDLFDSDLDQGGMVDRISEFLKRRGDEIEAEGKAVADLIVYYVGHGGFGKDNAFYLAIKSTNSATSKFHTSLAIDALAEAILRRAAFCRRYLILDCCYAASAYKAFLADPGEIAAKAVTGKFAKDDSTDVDEPLPSRGTALLCASSADRAARVHQSIPQTMFTWGLLETLKAGAPRAPSRMSIRDLCRLVAARIEKEFQDDWVRPVIHSPNQDLGDVAQVPFFPNVCRSRPEAQQTRPRAPVADAEREPDEAPPPPPVEPNRPAERAPALKLTSACEALDRFICTQSPLTVWVLAAILGGTVIFLGLLVDAHSVPISKTGAQTWTCMGGKQVGLWAAPNWSLVYLLLFPVFLSQISSVARHLRRIIDDLVANDAIIDEHGRTTRKAAIQAELRRELRANNFVFALLGAAVCLLALIGWWTSVGRAIYSADIGNQVVDWSTWAAACNRSGYRWSTLAFTFLAYLWMGIALFIYFACLFLGFIYASFLQRLAAGSQTEEGAAPLGRILFRRKMTTEHLRDFLTPYFIASMFGFLAAYCMRLQARFVSAPELNIMGYWIRDLAALFPGLIPRPDIGAPIQPDPVSNQTWFTAIFVGLITLVALLATARQLAEAFRDSREFLQTKLESKDSHQRAYRSYTPEEIGRINAAQFLDSVVPNAVPFALLTVGVGLAIAFGLPSLVFILTALAAGMAWAAGAVLRRRRANGAAAR